VIVNDIDRDEDYLLTFSDTQSEIVVPVFGTDGKTVKGTIDVKVNKRMHLIRKMQLSWKNVRSQFNRFGTTNNNK
jgi:GAF domain-containing protein